MQYLNFDNPANNGNIYLMPKNPVKVFGSLIFLALVFLPSIIWSGIKCLLTKRKQVNGQVILVRDYD